MNRVIRWAATLSASALLFGVVGLLPAHADDWQYDRGRDVRGDIRDIRQDQYRLSDLERRRDEARRCRNWNEARHLDREIDSLRRDMARDRRDIREDFQRARRYDDRDRNWNQNRDWNQDRDWNRNQDRNRNRDWNRDHRW